MQKVYKYPIHDLATREIELPAGAHILTVQMQQGQPCLWALVDPNAPMEKRQILIVGTEHALIEPIHRHVATFQMMEGSLVFHFFEGQQTKG